MSIKKILARTISVTTGLIMAAGIVVFGGRAARVEASDLTLVTDTSKVTYGTVTAEDIAMLEKLFDLNYYIARNPELVARLGNSYRALFDHFCRYGIFEGRTCTADFDPSAYVSAYPDAKAAAGGDILKAYQHYATVGIAENRTLTTVEACANSGITVRSIVDDSIAITPEVYRTAVQLGTDDYKAVTKALDVAKNAAAAGNTVIITNETQEAESGEPESGEEEEPSPSDDPGNVPEGYTKVGTISCSGGYLTVMVCQQAEGVNGYGAYRLSSSESSSSSSTSYVLITSIGDYTETQPSEESITVAHVNISTIDPATVVEVSPEEAEGTAYIRSDVTECATWTIAEPEEHETSGKDAEVTIEYKWTLSDGEEQSTTWTEGVVSDDLATATTTYDAGFRFTDSEEDSVSFNVSVNGNDGFTLIDEYEDIEVPSYHDYD